MTGTTSTKRRRRQKTSTAECFAPSPYSLKEAVKHADALSWISIIIFGFGNLVRKQYTKGVLFLVCEVAILGFLFNTGADYLPDFFTLGTRVTRTVTINGFPYQVDGDNSIEILLYSVMSLAAIVLLVYLATLALRSAYKAQVAIANGKKPIKFVDDAKSLLDEKAHIGFMTLPTAGIVLFTILPLIFMISMAFTNYDKKHYPLFTWVGFDNFLSIGSTGSSISASTFIDVLTWTLIWAFFATFLNFFFGMFIAMVINRKSTRLKGLWRTCFSLTIAVPQFVSLLIMNNMLQRNGAINRIFLENGWISEPLPFFQDATWARVTVILINLWVGIPFTIMQITGILQNVPAELYEAAELDGAGWWQRFMNVTMPYIIFVMTPYLITTFTGNINNFNVIYLLSGGAPNVSGSSAGKTDLLITWLYKLTVDRQYYDAGAVIGILTFVVLAVIALITYRSSGSYKNEEGFR
ncbi:carbohydrate ABC transporter permease [Gardnerella sp. 2492-Sm]|uniref:carbohydrate ABC transporter permease n=1 Tax=unclassified Gardnerella TaxID=2628112 RepID=UPI003D094DD9